MMLLQPPIWAAIGRRLSWLPPIISDGGSPACGTPVRIPASETAAAGIESGGSIARRVVGEIRST